MFSAFALADFTTLAIISAAPLGVNFNIANASSTFFPLTRSQICPAFLGDTRTYLAVAFASICYCLGTNSPNLCPTMSSVIYTGTCLLPS